MQPLLKVIPVCFIILTLHACKSTTNPYSSPSVEEVAEAEPTMADEVRWTREPITSPSFLTQKSVELTRYHRGDKYLDFVNLTSDILFSYDKANIRPEAETLIDDVFAVLESKKTSEQFVYVVGHTDSDGSEAYNVGLSTRRAMRVVERLKDKGMDPERVFVVPAGEHMPKVSNSSKDNKAKNRRVEIYISPWRDTPRQFIRDWECPDEQCKYARVSLLPIDQSFQLKETTREAQFEERIMPMQESYERATSNFNQSVRQAPEFPIIVRDTGFEVQIRRVPNLGNEYQADMNSPQNVRLVKQLEDME